jgi:hypothetical protein
MKDKYKELGLKKIKDTEPKLIGSLHELSFTTLNDQQPLTTKEEIKIDKPEVTKQEPLIRRYTKKDFLKLASKIEKEKFKKMKLEELIKFYDFTHKNEKTGQTYKAIKGMHCLKCFSILTPDFRNKFNSDNCADC